MLCLQMSWQCKSWNCIARARKQPFRPTQCFLQNFNELCHCLPGAHWARRAQFSRVVRWLTIMNQFEACEIKQWTTWEELWLVQSFQSSHQSVVEILKTFWISKIQFLPGHVLPSHLLPHAVALALGEGQHAFFCGWTTLPGFGAPDPTTTVSSLKVSPASKEVPWFKFQAKVFRWHSWGHISSHTAETLLGKQHAPKVHPWPT